MITKIKKTIKELDEVDYKETKWRNTRCIKEKK